MSWPQKNKKIKESGAKIVYWDTSVSSGQQFKSAIYPVLIGVKLTTHPMRKKVAEKEKFCFLGLSVNGRGGVRRL